MVPLPPPPSRPEVSVLIYGHAEGTLLAQAVRSARAAMAVASARGVACELLIVLDCPDPETKAVADLLLESPDRLIATQFGDRGRACNAGVAAARGRSVTLLGASGMCGSTWIASCHAHLDRSALDDTCLHPELTVTFGDETKICKHIGSDHPDFKIRHLIFRNPYSSLCFAPLKVFRETPYRPSCPGSGFGHEDWAWLQDTLKRGVRHLVVPETLHVIRKARSAFVHCDAVGMLPFPTSLFSGRSAGGRKIAPPR